MAGVLTRVATAADVPVIEALIVRSAAGLNGGHYSGPELAAAMEHIFGIDTLLVEDGSYFVAERGGEVVGCGGWSARETLFGSDRFAARDDRWLDPASEAARIRAFFVDPAHARSGVAGALLRTSETAALGAGFRRLDLMATLPGVAFYLAAGFMAGEPTSYLAGGVPVRFVPMTKQLSDPTGTIRRPASPQVDQRFGGAMS
ncbi:GNAT family N-acetyltransferase [Sphingomonas bacterium]|uniref:GNAT family N-acetyltransferase n=1 Tax=Sphingomonas bacterium TaxID=1895847 RepID=UPI0015773FE9|nr:GNAT family N-acetyltransferase [Sphingomonas bacterium]